MYNRVRIQQECIEYICDILGPEVYEAHEGTGTRTRLQYALGEKWINIKLIVVITTYQYTLFSLPLLSLQLFYYYHDDEDNYDDLFIITSLS